ncbi:anthranilate synthase, component II [Oceanobacillus limi]|uniref:Anthranilate synthase, component II n=1 Tax=Oceanobacillus limi TaxID=930131 RepID=A0A1I0CGK6_9BACI|nr:aminodeoxychorismate/anthranilate synthase component II [Oceanobacillus limi]SET18639.1 anthranilate synthase, component II [Oceanobacillus limi]
MILLIDNYDSFTYNLYQYFGELRTKVIVKRNDEVTIEEIKKINPDGIVLSPGPGHPDEAGICIEVIQFFYKKLPILGICLGHQVIGAALGATISQTKEIKHGKTSHINHNGLDLFAYLTVPLQVMRYHSLSIDKYTLPIHFNITASAMDDGEIMAIRHRTFPVFGLQFHPESIGTHQGKAIINNFLTMVREEKIGRERLSTETS